MTNPNTSNGENCDIIQPKTVPVKKAEVIDGYTIKYHANGVTKWSKGKILDGQPHGYWEWYRPDGTLKRSGHFEKGNPVGEWTTYDDNGHVYKVSTKK
jgi:antitoxin component YwqK of YwqJK toxin-antitoxin module